MLSNDIPLSTFTGSDLPIGTTIGLSNLDSSLVNTPGTSTTLKQSVVPPPNVSPITWNSITGTGDVLTRSSKINWVQIDTTTTPTTYENYGITNIPSPFSGDFNDLKNKPESLPW